MNKKYSYVIIALLITFGIGFIANRPDSQPSQNLDNPTSPSTNQTTTLDASGRQLTTLPDDILSQPGITDLNLSNNQLVTLPDNFADLTNLEKLNLENNRLDHVPEPLKKMTWLKSLDISNNRIPATEIPALKEALPDTEIKS